MDRNVSKVAPLFPAKRSRIIAQVGLLENATDAEIVRKAWDLCLTIVTANGDDFVKEITRFQNQTTRVNCHEMFALVVLPNGYESQRRLLQRTGEKLRLGTEKLTWGDVALKNWYVRLKKRANPEVKRFKRCFYCQKNQLA